MMEEWQIESILRTQICCLRYGPIGAMIGAVEGALIGYLREHPLEASRALVAPLAITLAPPWVKE